MTEVDELNDDSLTRGGVMLTTKLWLPVFQYYLISILWSRVND